MSSKRQRKKMYKKIGVWGFEAVIIGNCFRGHRGTRHHFSIGTAVKICCVLSEKSFKCVDYDGFDQIVNFNHVKKIR